MPRTIKTFKRQICCRYRKAGPYHKVLVQLRTRALKDLNKSISYLTVQIKQFVYKHINFVFY